MSSTNTDRTEDLLRRRQAKPFVPFTIVFADGKRHVIREPFSFTAINGKVMLPDCTRPVVDVVDVADFVEPRRMTDAESDLRDELIRCLLHRPFEPFTIRMWDGKHYDVVRRLQAAIGETWGRVVNADATGGTDFHIRDVQVIEQLARA